MQWLELTLSTTIDSTEAIATKLLALGVGGVEIEENWDWHKAKKDGLGDLFPVASGITGDTVKLRGYFPVSFLGSTKEKELHLFLQRLPEFGLTEAQLSWQRVDEADWENTWKEHWFPTPVGEKLVIVPAWLDATACPNRLALLLDPGAAFGTGTHESTQLCLELLETQVKGGESVLDLGCGSGILALAATLLGATDVTGVDYDELAVQASLENARLNKMHDRVSFFRTDLFESDSWQTLPSAAIITANLTADILLRVKDQIGQVLQPPGRIIMSGIINSRRDDVFLAMEAQGFRMIEERQAGQWVAFIWELKA
ncbi:MAG: 50S ribosomal protein L11 methyltransferase [Firmicutes bacterium]|nr:50S ribosomal protein L11 methyltransferase [Bacillota bacterium]